MKAKMGRPEKPENEQRTEFFTARFTSDEAKKLKAEIKQSGLKKSDWIRGRLLG